MNTLLLRLIGPLQSWGTQSRFSNRDTGREPSKSGVIGLLCAALGRDRAESIADLAALKMCVRVDAEGTVACDYHTVLGVVKANNPRKSGTVVSRRFYLADAAFLVALQGDDSQLPLIEQVHNALADPEWPLFLGRKSFVASVPIHIESGLLRNTDMQAALEAAPSLVRNQALPARLILECPLDEQTAVRMDQPVSFAERTFLPRSVRTTFVNLPAPAKEPGR